jgi:hypothetical protein
MLTPLDFARSQLGVTESGGENRGEPFARYAYPGEEPLPWCARFVRWCFENAHTPLPGNRWLIGQVAELRDALNAHMALIPLEQARAGDILFLRGRAGSDHGPGNHVGLVEHVSADAIETIDGNLGNRVARARRLRTDPSIWSAGRWPINRSS